MSFLSRRRPANDGEKFSVSYGEGVKKQFQQHLFSKRQQQILEMVSSIDRVEKTVDIDEKDMALLMNENDGWKVAGRVTVKSKKGDEEVYTDKVRMVKYEESEAVQALKMQVLATQGMAEIGDRARPSKKALRGWEKLIEYYARDQQRLGRDHPLVQLDRAKILRAAARLLNASTMSYHTDINVFEAQPSGYMQPLPEQLKTAQSTEK
jgi:hypothetical protein